MHKIVAVRVVTDDVKLHLPTTMLKPSDLCVAAHEIALPIKVFNDKRLEM